MSIELSEAKNLINMIENSIDNPKKLLTNSYNSNMTYLLNNIKIDNKYIINYLVDYLQSLDIFKNIKITFNGFKIIFSMNKLSHNNRFDPIIKIDIINHTYIVYDLSEYIDVINTEYTLRTFELSDFWKQFENYNIKKRFKLSNTILFNKDNKHKNIVSRIYDSIYAIVVSKKKIDNCLNREYKNINDKNNAYKSYYEKDIELQNYYKQHFPKHEELFNTNKNTILNFIKELGYIEESNSIEEEE